jgi:hypothetical protein
MFKLNRNLDGSNHEKYVELPTTASETYKQGEALVITSGAVTKCGATAAPTHICGCDYVAPATGNKSIPCYPIFKGYELETTLQAAGTSLVIGDKVTLHTDGLQVTATTTSGVAEIVKMNGTAVGSSVIVKF